MNITTTTTNGAAPKQAAIILCEGRGDYLTGLRWDAHGNPEVSGGDAAVAIRYTPAQAVELLSSLGRGYSVEPAPAPVAPAPVAFRSDWTPCSREWFADLAAYRAQTGDTPETDAVIAADTGDSSLIANLASLSRKLEKQRGALASNYTTCAICGATKDSPSHAALLAEVAALRAAIRTIEAATSSIEVRQLCWNALALGTEGK